MAKWLAWLLDVEVRRLTAELKHVRATRAQAARTAAEQHQEVLRLRARVGQLEHLLLNPNTTKEN